MLPENRKTLKEWAVVCGALDEGRQVVLFRKGGIGEKQGHFVVANGEFFLFPTYEHQNPEQLREEWRGELERVKLSAPPPGELRVRNYGVVEEVIETRDPEKLRAMAGQHIYSEKFLLDRLNWKPELPLSVLALRVYRLPEGRALPSLRRYGGCRSWIDLEEAIPTADLAPVVGEEEFGRRLEAIRSALR